MSISCDSLGWKFSVNDETRYLSGEITIGILLGRKLLTHSELILLRSAPPPHLLNWGAAGHERTH